MKISFILLLCLLPLASSRRCGQNQTLCSSSPPCTDAVVCNGLISQQPQCQARGESLCLVDVHCANDSENATNIAHAAFAPQSSQKRRSGCGKWRSCGKPAQMYVCMPSVCCAHTNVTRMATNLSRLATISTRTREGLSSSIACDKGEHFCRSTSNCVPSNIACNTTHQLCHDDVCISLVDTVKCRSWWRRNWKKSVCPDKSSKDVEVISQTASSRSSSSETSFSSVKTSHSFLGVSSVPTKSSSPRNSSKLAATKYRQENVTLVIEGDYDILVGGNEEKFIEMIRWQIAERLNISPRRITNMSVRPGSIIVEFSLQVPVLDTHATSAGGRSHTPSDSASALPADDALALLHQLVDSGELQLLDLHGQQLVVSRPLSEDDDSDRQEAAWRWTVVVVGVTLSATALAALAAVTAVCVKNKRRIKTGSLVGPLDRSQPSSTYKSFQFEHMMDGTVMSLENYVSSAESSRLSNNDFYLSDSEQLATRTTQLSQELTLAAAKVPQPPGYSSPSSQQLQQTAQLPLPLEISQCNSSPDAVQSCNCATNTGGISNC